jgi:hypothetical protein
MEKKNRTNGSTFIKKSKIAREEEKMLYKLERAAAGKIHRWWSQVNGSFAAKMKARAELQLKQEEEEMHMMARRIQAAWRRKKGGMAAHLKRQALREAEKERELELKAANKIHRWWSQVNGSFAAKMKARAELQLKQEEEYKDSCAKKIQHWWSMKNGSFAAKMKARAEIALMEEYNKSLIQAAIKIQNCWRKRQGWLSFLGRKKSKQKKYANEQWVICWDEIESICYFYDKSSDESKWEPPLKVMNSGRHTHEWYVCYDERMNFEYYLCFEDFTVHAMEYSHSEYSDYYNPPKLAKVGLRTEHSVIMEYVKPYVEEVRKPIKRTRKANKTTKMNMNMKKIGPEVEEIPLPPPVMLGPTENKKKKNREKKKKKKKKKKKHDSNMPQAVGRNRRKKEIKF